MAQRRKGGIPPPASKKITTKRDTLQINVDRTEAIRQESKLRSRKCVTQMLNASESPAPSAREE